MLLIECVEPMELDLLDVSTDRPGALDGRFLELHGHET